MSVIDNFDIYVGGTSGVFKGVQIGKEECVIQNIQNLVSITPNDEVTSISWGDADENQILIACGAKSVRSVKVYDTDCSTFTCSFFCNLGHGRITGISRYNEAILTAVHSGEIKLWKLEDEDEVLINAGENLKKMRHSKTNKHVIGTGGQENSLKLFDLERKTKIFEEKNVPHDWLQLRVPIWISDIEFLPTTEQIVTVGRSGHVRLYDPKAQRRPVINLDLKEETLTTLGIVPREKQIIAGSGKGNMKLIDLRKPAKILNTYKGFVGGVTGIACSKTEPYVFSVSLDRYLRIHHIDTKELVKKIYLTSRISCMLLRSEFKLPTENKNAEIPQNDETKVTGNLKEEQEKTRSVSDSDSEFDMLFDKMPVIRSEDHKKSKEKLNKKRKRCVTGLENSLCNTEVLPSKCTLRKNERVQSTINKPKKLNSMAELQ